MVGQVFLIVVEASATAAAVVEASVAAPVEAAAVAAAWCHARREVLARQAVLLVGILGGLEAQQVAHILVVRLILDGIIVARRHGSRLRWATARDSQPRCFDSRAR